MANLKEFKALYLASKGIDAKGNKLPEDKVYTEEKAKEEMTNYLLQNLCKSYAQIELAKEIGWFDETFADKIIKTAKSNKNLKKGKSLRKQGFVNQIKNEVNEACKTAKLDLPFKVETEEDDDEL